MAVLEIMARRPGWWMPEKSKNCLGKLPPFVQLYVLEADHEGILTLCFIYKENILI